MIPGAFDREALRASYRAFLADRDRVLLTGHSHQAWPDAVRDAMLRFFDDSARLVDDKWERAIFPMAERVGAEILERLGFERDDPIAFGPSTHALVNRLVSCLPLREQPRIVTTTGEFHSLRRQLARLAEEGVRVEWVDAEPRAALADRLLDALVPGTAMLAISAVLFEDAWIVPRLDEVLARAVSVGAIPLIDAYHAFNVVPLAWGPAKDAVFVTAGSYKYAGWGEGLCFLRVPRDCSLRPVDTGWFAEFAALGAAAARDAVAYGPGAARFAGATFDATALYRAEAALDHWRRFGLDVPALRAISLAQTERIVARLDARGAGDRVVSSREADRRGGFVAVRAPGGAAGAAAVVERLRGRGVFVDARRDLVRIGPAPYLTDDEIDRGVDAVADELS